MSEQILAKLEAMQTTIASLRAEVGGLQALVSTKADCAAFSALSSTVRGQGSMITSQGGMITAQGQAITSLTSRIDLPCGCNKASATAETALDTTRIQSASGAISIDIGKGVITISHPSGADKGRQVFISEESVATAAIVTEMAARAEADGALAARIDALATIQTVTLDNGLKAMAGLIRDSKLGEQLLSSELESRLALLEQGQAKQGGENRAVNDRLAVVELNRVSQKGLDEAAAVRTAQRIDALQAQIEILQGKIENRG